MILIQDFQLRWRHRGILFAFSYNHKKYHITTNLKTKYNQNCQKIELYGSPTIKDLKKKFSSRQVNTESWGESMLCGGSEVSVAQEQAIPAPGPTTHPRVPAPGK